MRDLLGQAQRVPERAAEELQHGQRGRLVPDVSPDPGRLLPVRDPFDLGYHRKRRDGTDGFALLCLTCHLAQPGPADRQLVEQFAGRRAGQGAIPWQRHQ
jgi:hypothetical protein